MSGPAAAYEINKALEGTEEGVGDWYQITQDQVNAFADATLDHQFIHVDPERAKATPFGGPIAHGFLTLSLLVHLDTSITKDPARFAGAVMGVNVGLDRVRFVNPVPVGSRVRARSQITLVELKGDAVQTKRTLTVEIEGSDKPALVAEWITRTYYG